MKILLTLLLSFHCFAKITKEETQKVESFFMSSKKKERKQIATDKFLIGLKEVDKEKAFEADLKLEKENIEIIRSKTIEKAYYITIKGEDKEDLRTYMVKEEKDGELKFTEYFGGH